MMAKNRFAVLGILASLLLVSTFIVADTSTVFSITELNAPTSINENETSFDFTFNLTYTGSSSAMNFSFDDSTTSIGTISIPDSNEFDGTVDESRIITGTITGFEGYGGETLNIRIVAKSHSGQIDNETTFSVVINNVDDGNNNNPEFEFCNWDGTSGFENGTDMIEIRKIRDNELDNSKEWEWSPYDEIELEVEIKNTGDDDEDYIVELIFMDKDGNEYDVAEDEDDLEEEISIDEGDREYVTFNFVVDGDIEEGDYDLYVKAYKDGDEDEQCVSVTTGEEGLEEIKVEKENHQVIVKSVDGEQTVKAGTSVFYEVKIANIGSRDEDKVRILVYNSQLGVDQYFEIDDLNEGDLETVSFKIDIPASVEDGNYELTFSTWYDYDKDDKTYDKNSDPDDEIEFFLSVVGGKEIVPTVDVSLGTTVTKVGQELIINVKVTNNGDEGVFSLSVEDLGTWATLTSITPAVVNLDEGETAEIVVALMPQESGTHSFRVVANIDGEEGLEVTRAVTISENVDSKITGNSILGNFGVSDNNTAYLIIGITAILILVLLILIVKVSKKSGRVEY